MADNDTNVSATMPSMYSMGLLDKNNATSGEAAPLMLDSALRVIAGVGASQSPGLLNTDNVNGGLKMENAALFRSLDTQGIGGISSILSDALSKIALQGNIHSAETHGNVGASAPIGASGELGEAAPASTGNASNSGSSDADFHARVGGTTIEGIPIQAASNHDFEVPRAPISSGASHARAHAHSDDDDHRPKPAGRRGGRG